MEKLSVKYMKKASVKIISLILIAVTAAAFAGCNDNPKQQPQTTTAPVQNTADEANEEEDDKNALPFPKYAKNGDDFTGAWKITEGVGSQYDSFTYSFDGEGRIAIVIDNYGYLGKYEIKDNTFTTQMIFGLNGEYTYTLSDDCQKIELVKTEDNSQTTLEKVVKLDCVPKTDGVDADEELLGAWKSEDEEYFYFDESGLMYHNQYNTMFNYAVYTVKGDKISASYKMGEEMSDEYEYTVEGDLLTLNGYRYERIKQSELK